jgi:hypothetical protein
MAGDLYADLDLQDDCSPLRPVRHASIPFGNEGFEHVLRHAALSAEQKPQEKPAEPTSAAPSSDDPRVREIAALRADVAALRCSLANLEILVGNLIREFES